MREISVEYNPKAIEYGMMLMEHVAQVRVGQKPLVIGEESKCPTAFQALVDIANESPELDIERTSLIGEDGEITSMAFVCPKGAPYAREAIEAIFNHIGDVAYRGADLQFARKKLQYRIGMLLGYSAFECQEFVASDAGQTCPCDCCGGPETTRGKWGTEVHEGPVEHVTLETADANPGRFIANSYRY